MSSLKRDSYEIKCFYLGDHCQCPHGRCSKQPRKQNFPDNCKTDLTLSLGVEKDRRIVITRCNRDNRRPQSEVGAETGKPKVRNSGSHPSISSLRGGNSKSSWCHLVKRKLSRRQWGTNTLYSLESTILTEAETGINMHKCKHSKCKSSCPKFDSTEERCTIIENEDSNMHEIPPSAMTLAPADEGSNTHYQTAIDSDVNLTRYRQTDFAPSLTSSSKKADKSIQSQRQLFADAGSQASFDTLTRKNLFQDDKFSKSIDDDDDDRSFRTARDRSEIKRNNRNDLKPLIKLEALQNNRRFELLMSELVQLKKDVREIKDRLENAPPTSPSSSKKRSFFTRVQCLFAEPCKIPLVYATYIAQLTTNGIM